MAYPTHQHHIPLSRTRTFIICFTMASFCVEACKKKEHLVDTGKRRSCMKLQKDTMYRGCGGPHSTPLVSKEAIESRVDAIQNSRGPWREALFPEDLFPAACRLLLP